MIWYVEVLIEHRILHLSRPFTYCYEGHQAPLVGVRVEVEFAKQSLIGFILSVSDVKPVSSYTLKPILRMIDEQPILNDELIALAKHYATTHHVPMIAMLQTMLPPSLKPTRSSLKAPKIAYEDYVYALPLTQPELMLTPRQLSWYLLLKAEDGTPKKVINNPSMIKKLIELGAICIKKIEKRRTKIIDLHTDSVSQLTADQQAVIHTFLSSDKHIHLLYGVTGSGKTEVYLALAKQTLEQGKSVLMIVPEIALTPVMVSYFKQRFHQSIAVLHSELTKAEKYDEYRRIASGDAKIVIGARSAIFAPLRHLGLIMLDEEHSDTYKQDAMPSYHARDVALWRSEYHGIKVLLGSATPSLESKARADKGVYGLLTLKDRINEKAPPRLTIVDLHQTHLLHPEASIFTTPLLAKMQEKLAKQEQIILLVNKRGYASVVVCRQCDYRFTCPKCEVSLAYHEPINALKCHYCGYHQYWPKTCPSCQHNQLMKQGFGTQKVEAYLHQLFPTSRIGRLDTDNTMIRHQATTLLSAFQQQKIDILVGTQMVAKGHDFPNVTLVGVLLADLGLNVPNYRASEKTFQLLSQVVGRTGRGQKDGEAIIQTYHPEHFVIQTGAQQQYEAFYRQEMQARKLTQYPPYTYLVMLEWSSDQLVLLTEVSMRVYEFLNEKLGPTTSLLGPTVPFPEKLGPMYRRRFIIKYKDLQQVQPIIDDLRQLMAAKSQVRLNVNFDPYEL